MTKSQPKAGRGTEQMGRGVGVSHWGTGKDAGTGSQNYGLGALHGGCSEAVDALPERGYTIHVASLRELANMLHPEGHRR